MNLVVVCNAENRRAALFCNAARQLGYADPYILSYSTLLNNPAILTDTLNSNTWLRIESPGENFSVEQKLIALGARVQTESTAQYISETEALALLPDMGRIRYLRQWYLGFSNVLTQLNEAIAQCGCAVFNSPQAIKLMFDKVACQQHLASAHIAVPASLPAVANYDALRTMMLQRAWKRIFIKPAHASSASGVIAYRLQGNHEEAITSMALVRIHGSVQLYNVLKVKRYTEQNDIRTLVDFILREGAIIEEWIPKASIHGKSFDVRVVVINGKAQFILPRLSKGPLTNLHLGNQRGTAADVRALVGEVCFNAMIRCAEDAVKRIDGALYAGVDVLIPAGFGKPRVLELNAFGDLLPGLLNHEGNDTYTAELKTLPHVR